MNDVRDKLWELQKNYESQRGYIDGQIVTIDDIIQALDTMAEELNPHPWEP